MNPYRDSAQTVSVTSTLRVREFSMKKINSLWNNSQFWTVFGIIGIDGCMLYGNTWAISRIDLAFWIGVHIFLFTIWRVISANRQEGYSRMSKIKQ